MTFWEWTASLKRAFESSFQPTQGEWCPTSRRWCRAGGRAGAGTPRWPRRPSSWCSSPSSLDSGLTRGRPGRKRTEEAKPTLKNTRVRGKTRQANLHLHLHLSFTHSFLKLYSWAPGRNTSNKVKLEKKDKSALMQNKSLEFRQVYERSREFMGIHKVHSRVCNSFIMLPSPEVVWCAWLAILAITCYGHKGDTKPDLQMLFWKLEPFVKRTPLTSEPMSQ